VSALGPPLTAVFARAERMVGRRIAEQFLLVPIVSRGADVDSLFNLNQVGTFIWERLDGKTPGSRIVESLVAHFAVERGQAESDYRSFLASLLEILAVEEVAEP
jgi:hypothetical protein